MKRWIIGALCLTAAFVLAWGFGEKRTGADIEEDGGVRNNSDLGASKVIRSTEIKTFSCYFSTLALAEEHCLGSFDYYTMKATRKEDGSVEGFYYPAYRHSSKDRAYTFYSDNTFLEKLQTIVSDYDLVQYNGMDLMVSALPDQYGVDLSIEYDSGETIKAYNNQENFLSFEAMRALKELFRSEITE